MNTQITEDYVSFEIAKLLKEKGFNEECFLGYDENKNLIPTGNSKNSQLIPEFFCKATAPTLQMAMKWLREVHKININILYDSQRFVKIDGTIEYVEVYEVDIITKNGTFYIGNYNHYESAAEAAIKYYLKNLMNK